MAKRVLSVGNCGFDHGNITGAIRQHFRAEVVPAATADEAVSALQQGGYDLVMVNRVFDADADSGLDLIQKLKADEKHRDLPVMLISNYPDAQDEAKQKGAVTGFGKTQVGKPHMLEALRPYLG
jgi:two-component system chemotaxis response regulator CheY